MNKMKTLISKILVVAFLVTGILLPMNNVAAKQEGKAAKPADRKKTEILVKFKDETKSSSVIAGVKGKAGAAKMNIKKKMKNTKVQIIEIDEKDNLDKVVEELKKDPQIEYAQPNLELTAFVGDPLYGQQWGLKNVGQAVNGITGAPGIDIGIEKAWEVTSGQAFSVIGVLDTGIDIAHPDLSGSIYQNPNEIPGNNLDDDGNGYIDDINGWDFANGDNTVYDQASGDKHGTHIAGIIAAQANDQGITGTAPGVRILPLKFISGTSGFTSDAIEAIEYAKQMGIRIINASFGCTTDNPALKDAIQNSGILFVCAAGNNGQDSTQAPVYPAAFNLPNILSVAAMDSQGELASFSNYGRNVDIAAPGVGILSTIPEGEYAYMSGTSMAAPFVSAVAALLKSLYPDLLPSEIVARIKNNSITRSTLDGKLKTGGFLHAYGALTGEIQAIEEPEEEQEHESSGEDSLMEIAAAVEISNELKEQIHYGEEGVNPATGNYSTSSTDMTMAAPGFTVNISRTYNSKDERTSSTLGRGWTFGFEGSFKLENAVTAAYIAKLPNGSAQVFIKYGDTYIANDSRSTLVKQSDNTYILTTKDQYTYGFDTNGWLYFMEDRNGNRIDITVDSTGKVQAVKDCTGREFKINYDTSGKITSITDPMGRTVIYRYTNNLLTQVIHPDQQETTYCYDSANYLTAILDHNATTVASITYDHAVTGANKHKVTKTIDAFGKVTTFQYDTDHKKTTITTRDEQNQNERTLVKEYDTAFFIVKSTDPEGRTVTVEYLKDADGYNKYGEEIKITDRYGNTTEYQRDDRGNITKIINPDKSEKTYQYDDKNNLIKETDETGRCIQYLYDSAQVNLLKKILPLNGTDEYNEGSSDPSKFAITTYTYYTDEENQQLGYTAKGLLKSETNPEGGTTTYTYDPYGNTKTITSPEGNVTTKEYNLLGWLTAETSPAGYRTEYTYDLGGRLIKQTLEGGETLRTVYDLKGRKTQEITPNQYNQLADGLNFGEPSTTYTDSNQGTRYTYYAHDKIHTQTDAMGNVWTYEYDIYGNKIKETRPDGSAYEYTYDVMDRIIRSSFRENTTAAAIELEEYAYTILPDGKRQTTKTQHLSDTETAITVFTYDYAGRLIEQVNPDGGKSITRYNANGTVASTTNPNGGTTYYKYDGLNRLTETWSPVSYQCYTYTAKDYDRAGRITVEKTGKDLVELYATPAQDRILTKNYTYDADGRVVMISDADGRKTICKYDAEGNKIREDVYTSPGISNTTEITYNHLGKPVAQKTYIENRDLDGKGADSLGYTALVTTYIYDKNGNLLSTTTPDGITTKYTYDALNRQLTRSMPGLDDQGLPVTFVTSTTYDWEGKVLTTTDANGNRTEYHYTPRGFLERTQKTVTDNGVTIPVTELTFYDRAGRKIATVSPENYIPGADLTEMNHTEYTYDKMGRVKLVKETFRTVETTPEDATWKTIVTRACQYDLMGNLVKELDGSGYESGIGTNEDQKIAFGYGTQTQYDLSGRIVSILDAVAKERGLKFSVQYQYDGAGRKISETNAKGVITEYSYDSAGNLLETSVKKSADDLGQITSTRTYDLAGRMLTQSDANGNVTTYEYNALGKVRKMITPADETIPQNTVTYQYDVMGNLKQKQETDGTTERYTYDWQGRLLTQTRSQKDGKNTITTTRRYDKNGNIRFEIDGNGNTTEYLYDELNRCIEIKTTVTDSNGAKSLRTTRYAYDKNGNKISETDWLGNTVQSRYDALNRLIQKIDQNGTVIQTLEYNSSHLQVKSIDAKGGVTKYTYDKQNRLLATTDPMGYTTRQDYDYVGNLAVKTDGRGNKTTYEYDLFNRLTAVTAANGDRTVYGYDLNGNLLFQTDGKGNMTLYEYNAANKIIKRIDPSGRTGTPGSYTYNSTKVESYTYTADGSLYTVTDRNGVVTTHTYDTHGRLLTKAAGDETVTYSYDANGNQRTITDSTGTTTRVYDELNRVIAKTVPGFGTTTFQYDILEGVEAGDVAETSVDPKGNTTTKVYDKVGRLKEVRANGITTYTYDANGNRESVTYPGGTKESYTYDANNKLITLINQKADGTILDCYTYSYDANGNQTEKQETINGIAKGITRYTYDSQNRLESVIEPDGKVTEYTYDAAGNRESETVTQATGTKITTYEYNEQNRLMVTTTTGTGMSKETTRYTYDNNGNMIHRTVEILKKINPMEAPKKPSFGMFIPGQTDPLDILDDATRKAVQGTSSYAYNVWNQMVRSTGAQTATYTYNAEGLRVEKTVDGKTTKYLYEYDKVILEVDEQGRQTARNVYGTNLLTRTVEGETLYYLYNGHADVTALVNTLGTVVASYDYDAFGNILEKNGTADNPYRYSGYRYDEETDLYYLNARYYDAKIARFMSEDTYRGRMGDPLSLNLYTYCVNNPVIYYDPTGHDYVLRKGMYDNDQVKAVQEKLIKLGYDLGKYGADGDFGNATYNAVVQFQKDYNLKVDGIVGNQTLTVLTTAYNLHQKGLSDYAIHVNVNSVASTAQVGSLSGGTVLMSQETYNKAIKEITDAKNSTGQPEKTVVKTAVTDGKVVVTGVQIRNDPPPQPKKDTANVTQNTSVTGTQPTTVATPAIQSTTEVTPTTSVIEDIIEFLNPGAVNRAKKVVKSPSVYNIVNWASNGLLDSVKGAIAPEEPLSVSHFVDSFVTVTVVGGPVLRLMGAGSKAAVSSVARNVASGTASAADDVAKVIVNSSDDAAKGTSKAQAPQKVIGHYPEYVEMSEKLGTKPFSIPDDIWNKMTKAEQWAANQKFLDRAIAKGAEFNLATPIDKVRPGSFLEKEINYLLSQGYKFINNGTKLVK